MGNNKETSNQNGGAEAQRRKGQFSGRSSCFEKSRRPCRGDSPDHRRKV